MSIPHSPQVCGSEMKRHICLRLTLVLQFWQVERGSWSNRPGLRVAAYSCRPAPVPACLCLHWTLKEKNATVRKSTRVPGGLPCRVGTINKLSETKQAMVPRGLPKTPLDPQPMPMCLLDTDRNETTRSMQRIQRNRKRMVFLIRQTLMLRW